MTSWFAPGGRARRRWTLSSLLAATALLGWLDLLQPNGIFGWVFVAVVIAAAAAGLRWARPRRGSPSAEVSALQMAAESPVGPVGAWVLFREALLLGLTGFGGGLAVLSQIEQRLVERRRWIPIRRFLETAAIAQGLPGAVATNALAMIGLELRGVPGALLGTLGFILPSFLMMLIAALLYSQLRHLPAVDGMFRGLNPAVAALVLLTAIRLGGRVVLQADGRPGGWWALWRDRWSFAVMLASALGVSFARIGVVEVVVMAGALGVIRWTLRQMPDPSAAFGLRWRWFRHRVVVAARVGARVLPLPWWRRWAQSREDDLLAISPMWILVLSASAIVTARLAALGGLSTVFLRAGAVTFGGGFAMIPLLESELVQTHGWLTAQEFADAVALGQVTPGPVVITATFVGYRVAGILGALVATLSVFAPAWLMALAIGGSVRRVRESPGVQAFLNGIQPAVVGLMMAAAVALTRSGVRGWLGAAVALAALASMWRWKLSPAYVLLGATVLGVAWRYLLP